MKVKFIIGSLEIGGAERHLVQILPELKSKGLDFSVIVLSEKAKLKPVLEKAGVKVKTGFNISFLPSFLRRPLRLIFSITTLIKDFLLDRQSVRHTFLPEAYLLTAIAARICFSKNQLVMSRRSLNNYQLRRPFLTKLERFFHKFTNFALGNSKAVVDQLYEEGFSVDKVGLIYNGINTWPYKNLAEKSELRSKLGLCQDSILVVIVANLIPYKGHEDLLNAFSLIKNEINCKWQLLCVGRDNGILKSLKNQAFALNIADNIEFMGSRTDTMEIMKASDIGVLCSHEEGFSNSILECMAAGLPMVVTNVGGNAEAVLDMHNGFVVPSKNPKLLSDSLLALLISESVRKKFGVASQERVQQLFSLDNCINNYMRFYKALFEGGK